jgi:signal transduction histidine kinase
MLKSILNLQRFSIIILFIVALISVIIIISSYFIINTQNLSSYYTKNEKIAIDYSNKFGIYVNYTSSYLEFAKQYANRFDIYNSTLDDYVKLSALNNSNIFTIINNVRIHYNVSDINRSSYENRMSTLLNQNVTFTDLQIDGSSIISPKRDWYCPTFFVTPLNGNTIYRPGFDICNFMTTKPVIDKLINNQSELVIEPRNGILIKAIVLDFLSKSKNSFVFLTIAINNILQTFIKDNNKIQLIKNNVTFYDGCNNINCQNYSQMTQQIVLPNGEFINMVVLFPLQNQYSQLLYILLIVCFIDLSIFLVILNFDIKKNKYIVVDRMLAYVNHEIRTPISCINGLIEICLIKLGNMRNELQSNLYTAKRACDMLIHIVNDILDLKKIKDGKLVIHKSVINIDTFTKNLYKILLPKLNEKPDIEYIFQNPDNIENIYYDEQRLLQILLNFITNSLKFTDIGTVILFIEMIDKNKIQISVIDTGRGIEKNKYKKIFKPFDQSELSDSLRQGGVGLGLYLCKMIIDQMGDQIGFSSEINSGTTFWIAFNNKKLI